MSDENLVQYSVYGSMVTDGEGFMGLFSTVNLLNDKIEEIQKLQAQLDEANKVIDMVENNTKMPHQHKDYYERLCCLSERAREYKEKYKAVSE
jgi:hypothetical protein